MSEYHVDAALSNLVMQEGVGRGYAYQEAFPEFRVAKQSDKFFTLSREQLRHDIESKLHERDSALRWEWEYSTDSYVTHRHGLIGTVYDADRANADPAFSGGKSLDNITTMKTVDKIQLAIEKEARTPLVDTATYSNTTPSVKWDATTGVIDIFGDIIAAKRSFKNAFGAPPNLIIFEPSVADVVVNDSAFLDRVRYFDARVANADVLPPVIAGMRTFVPGRLEDTANPAATASIANIWSTDRVMLLHVNTSQNPALGEPSFGYDVKWTGFGSGGIQVSSARMGNPNRTEYLVETYHVIKVVASDGLYILDDTLT